MIGLLVDLVDLETKEVQDRVCQTVSLLLETAIWIFFFMGGQAFLKSIVAFTNLFE